MNRQFVIVVADDDVDDQELIRHGFEDCKADVAIITVYDGIKLMDFLLKRHTFRDVTETADLILLDLNMPLMDGFEVLKQIGKYPQLKKTPIYVITTSRNDVHRSMALELGATGFYSKGASSQDIRRIMQQICQDCFEEG